MTGGRRVVVTGIGCVSSIGIGVDAFIDGIKHGRSGISEVRAFDTSDFPNHLGGEVHDFDASAIVQTIEIDKWGRTAQFAAAAARLSFDDSKIELDEDSRWTTGAIIGTTNGEAPSVDVLTQQWLDAGPSLMGPDLIRRVPAGNIAAAASVELGLHGETMTIGGRERSRRPRLPRGRYLPHDQTEYRQRVLRRMRCA